MSHHPPSLKCLGRFVVILCALALACTKSVKTASPDTDVDAQARKAWLMKLLSDAAASPFSSTPTIRQYTFMALYLLAVKSDPTSDDAATAKGYIATAFQYQCMDSGSTYGYIRSRTNTDYDFNSTAFVLQGVAPILAKYRSAFTSDELAAILPHVDAALSALDTHSAESVQDTNIYLMRATDLVVIGEALLPLDDKYQHFVDRGYALLDHWKDLTSQAGIAEFDSPTYYAVALDALVVGYLHAAQKTRYANMLDTFWADIAANYFPARGSLSGPHSRDYLFLTGDGGIESYLYIAGWRTEPPADTSSIEPDLERVFTAYNLLQGGYAPSQSARTIAFTPSKMVTQTWGCGKSTCDRSNYVGAAFTIGGVSHDYASYAQEKVIALELGGASTVVSLVTEDDQTQDNPYGGKVQQGDFNKTYRIPSWPVVAQKDGVLLVTSYAAPVTTSSNDDLNNPDTTLLATSILLPPEASLSRSGSPVTSDADLAVGDVVAVRVGDGGGAIRILRADDCSGQPATPKLKYEKSSATATSPDRTRIVGYHKSGSSARGCAARVGLLVAGEDCTDGVCQSAAALATATITESFTSPSWSISADLSGVSLAIGRSDDFVASAHTILSRTVNGAPVSTTRLELNGNNIAPAL